LPTFSTAKRHVAKCQHGQEATEEASISEDAAAASEDGEAEQPSILVLMVQRASWPARQSYVSTSAATGHFLVASTAAFRLWSMRPGVCDAG
jgi:hypothetical protein